MSTDLPPTSPTNATRPPAALGAAVVLVGLEAVALVVLGVLELTQLAGARLAMGLTTATFFLVYGAGLAYCAARLLRLHSWARAPLVLAQLIQVFVAWGFRGGSTVLVSVLLMVVGVAALAAILAPATTRALADPEDSTG